MGGQEGHQGRLGVEAEGVIVQVDGVEFRKVENGGEEVGEGFGDFVKESAGEDIGKVRDLDKTELGDAIVEQEEWYLR